MPKFNVYATILAPLAVCVEVEANDQDSASIAAKKKLLGDETYKVLDFDGNRVAIIDRDIKIDGCDELVRTKE